ncbi:hypothetical protein FJTKL_05793 [Diaporthe vaccinii]|uniref:Uncharacterized protein n=1 Tax=Diaporthe vaccinii TaxID=105482 RepID=A0ABR4EY02_9PEZI
MGFISGILYVVILILNAMCILSEDRFLARINLSPKSIDPTFGQSGADASVWSKVASLISSVRMVVRCTFGPQSHPFVASPSPSGFRRPAVWAQDPYIERRADTKTHTANSPSDIRKCRDNSLRADPGMSGPVGNAARRTILPGEPRGQAESHGPTGAGQGGCILMCHSSCVYYWGILSGGWGKAGNTWLKSSMLGVRAWRQGVGREKGRGWHVY